MSKMSKILKLKLESRRIANIYMQLAHNLKYLLHQKYVLTQNRATSLFPACGTRSNIIHSHPTAVLAKVVFFASCTFNTRRTICFYEYYCCDKICDIVAWHIYIYILAVIKAVHSGIQKFLPLRHAF